MQRSLDDVSGDAEVCLGFGADGFAFPVMVRRGIGMREETCSDFYGVATCWLVEVDA